MLLYIVPLTKTELWPPADLGLPCFSFVVAAMAPKAVPFAVTALRSLLWCLSTSKAQFLFVWTALTQHHLAVYDRRLQLLRVVTSTICHRYWHRTVPLVHTCTSRDLLGLRGPQAQYLDPQRPSRGIRRPSKVWRRMWSTTKGRWASAAHANKSCAFAVERHQRSGLRAVAAEGTAFIRKSISDLTDTISPEFISLLIRQYSWKPCL